MNKSLILEKSNDTRQQIIDVAKTIILGKGFSAVGLNEILTSASVPKGSFYHYFTSKEAFGNALLSDYFDDYTTKLSKDLKQPSLLAAERLQGYFANWLETQSSDTTQDKCLVVKLSAEVSDLSESMRTTLQLGTQKVIYLLQACLQEAIDSNTINSHEPAETIAQELYYLWLGATLMTKVQHTRDALECAMRATEKRLNLQITPRFSH